MSHTNGLRGRGGGSDRGSSGRSRDNENGFSPVLAFGNITSGAPFASPRWLVGFIFQISSAFLLGLGISLTMIDTLHRQGGWALRTLTMSAKYGYWAVL